MKKSPYTKDILSNCNVCRQYVYIDQYGNGQCINCGWQQDRDYIDNPDRVIYPNVVSFNKAKLLYNEGKPFIPSLEDFLDGLFFYSEMEFSYKGRRFGVFLRKDFIIELYEGNIEESMQSYKTKEDFMNNAHIGGMLLKNIWNDVENSGYMSCADWD